MAKYNEILVGRFNRALQKLTGIKGGPVSPQLAGEIGPTLSMFYGIENRYLESWNRFGASIATAAQAANASAVKIRNPPASNVIIVLEQIAAQSNVADANVGVGHGASATDYNTIASLTNTRLDPRGNPQPIAIISSTSGAQSPVAFGATIDNIGIASAIINQRIGIVFLDDHEVPILPGEAVQLAGGTVNEILSVTYYWRERFLEESERS